MIATVLQGLPGAATSATQAGAPAVTPNVTWGYLAPILIMFGGALLLLLLGALMPNGVPRHVASFGTVVVGLASMASGVPLWLRIIDPTRGPTSAVAGAVGVDGFSVFAYWVIAAAVVLVALLFHGYLAREGLEGVEPYALMMFSAAGAMVMASANDLVVLFIGLEILSLAAYTLAAMHRRRIGSLEAGLKYFILGAAASACLLYGIALLYGATGTTSLGAMRTYLDGQGLVSDNLLLGGIAMVIIGLGFKVAAVPFHWWAPDVYQGSPTPVTAFMASAIKAGAFAGLLRLLVVALPAYRGDWRPVIEVLALLSLFGGAFGAIVQTDVKRMLAYSSINHAGFILVAVDAASAQGISAALFYLAVYSLMTIGAFAVVTVISREGDGHTSLADLRGLPTARPALALALVVFVLAQAGVPFTGGFFAKFGVITAAVDAGHWWMGVAAMVSAVVSAFLYLRIVGAMYWPSDEAEDGATPAVTRAQLPFPRTAGIALGLCLVGVLIIGIFPGLITNLTRQATVILG